jgi:chromosomal replication initiation ATPase DnaA
MAKQLLFDLPVRVARGRDDFIVSGCNQVAVDLIDQWPEWQNGAAVLVGPVQSGRSHLVEVWRQRSNAHVLKGSDLTHESLEPLLALKAIAVDDADGLVNEEALFHLFNALKANQGHLLLTSKAPPARWQLTLPDLRSRLATAMVAELSPPDDELLKGLFTKLFQDHQTDVKEGVITFIIKRIERSFETATRLADDLNKEALRQGRSISIPLVREVMAQP